ncbi:MAG: restriction endonuclease subunit S [Spiroplasma phoeniceum]|uniref:restriction endonuclease subunit S n=1 Tax=Spiroplasma phoeniceum TaxID=47835 RepID=UPI00327F10B6
MNKSLVPKIRFKGFNDEWKKYKLNDIGFFFRGLYKKTKADFEINNSNFYYVTYTNIYNNSFIKIDSLKYVNINNNEKQNRLIKGDILFTMTSETYNEVGICSIFISDIDNVYLNSFCSGFRIINIKAINSIFLLFLLLSIQYREKIIKMANGFTRYNLSKKLLLNLQVKIPNIIQQNKIADFFTIIDRKIELIKEQLILLEKQKQYYLNNMFANEKSYPKIRFKGFNDFYYKTTFNKFYNKGKSGGTPSTKNKDFYNGEISFLSIKDVTNQGKYIFETEKTITKKGLKNSSAWLVPKNSLIYSIYASVGFPTINKIPLATSQAFFSMEINNLYFSTEYLYYLLLKFKKKELNKFIIKQTQPNLSKEIINQFIFKIPSLQEQTKIAHFFTIIDRKIELIKEQLNLLEKQKQYYLNNMFI